VTSQPFRQIGTVVHLQAIEKWWSRLCITRGAMMAADTTRCIQPFRKVFQVPLEKLVSISQAEDCDSEDNLQVPLEMCRNKVHIKASVAHLDLEIHLLDDCHCEQCGHCSTTLVNDG